MGKQPRTLMEVCVSRAGGGWRDAPRGIRVCMFIAEWTLASWAEDRPLIMADYLRFWGHDQHYRTAWRRLAEFRELFPDIDTPQEIADRVEKSSRVPDPKSVHNLMTVPFPSAIAA